MYRKFAFRNSENVYCKLVFSAWLLLFRHSHSAKQPRRFHNKNIYLCPMYDERSQSVNWYILVLDRLLRLQIVYPSTNPTQSTRHQCGRTDSSLLLHLA